MYSNNADTIQEILCFFLDETKGQDIAYVQFPQSYNNITKNDHYGNSYFVSSKVSDKNNLITLNSIVTQKHELTLLSLIF